MYLTASRNIKNLDNIPGIHLRVTNIGINFLLRYPGQTFAVIIGRSKWCSASCITSNYRGEL
jgi:hypothetical protein